MEEKRMKKFRRIPDKGWVGGVCAGIAYYLGFPVWIVRLVWALLIFGYGTGLLLYILLWIFVPEAKKTPSDYNKRT